MGSRWVSVKFTVFFILSPFFPPSLKSSKEHLFHNTVKIFTGCWEMECQHISEQESHGIPQPAVLSSSGRKYLVAFRFLEKSASSLLGVIYNCPLQNVCFPVILLSPAKEFSIRDLINSHVWWYP